MTCDQDHAYTAEQLAADHGAEDMYAQNTGNHATLATCLAGLKFHGKPEPVPPGADSNFAVMDYYDGNTVTGLWNYAQHFAMSDNAFGTTLRALDAGCAASHLGAGPTEPSAGRRPPRSTTPRARRRRA